MISTLNIRLVNCSNCGYVIQLRVPFWEGVTGPFIHWDCGRDKSRMKNLGSISGKVEILHEKLAGSAEYEVTLVASSNVIKLTALEALDLGDVISYAATGQLEHLPKCETFIPKVSDATEGQ